VNTTASRGGRGVQGPRLLTSRVARMALPVLVVVAVFAGVLPQITDYAEAWSLTTSLSTAETLLLAVLAIVNLGSYALLWMAAVPGLGWGRATLVDLASTAVANTVPAGFAFGVGTTATMYHSFGISAGAITRAVALTGIWNNLVKLGMPVVALAGLTLTGQATGAVRAAAAVGLVLLLSALLALVLVLTHGGAAAGLARAAEGVAGRLATRLRRRPPSGWVAAVERFRTESLDLVRRRWPHLPAAALGSHVALFVLLLACIRLVDGTGADVGWLRVLAVFSITRLVTMIPITPGALGVAELSYVAGLTAVGMDAAAAGASVLLFRFLTWFLPIPCGAVAWLLWRRSTGPAALPPAGAHHAERLT
jgi:putative heme transporter